MFLARMYNIYIIIYTVIVYYAYTILLCMCTQIYYSVIYYTNVYLHIIKIDYYLFRNVYTVFIFK